METRQNTKSFNWTTPLLEQLKTLKDIYSYDDIAVKLGCTRHQARYAVANILGVPKHQTTSKIDPPPADGQPTKTYIREVGKGVKQVWGSFPGGRQVYMPKYLWEQAYGAIEPHLTVGFIDGDSTNIAMDNLKLQPRMGWRSYYQHRKLGRPKKTDPAREEKMAAIAARREAARRRREEKETLRAERALKSQARIAEKERIRAEKEEKRRQWEATREERKEAQRLRKIEYQRQYHQNLSEEKRAKRRESCREYDRRRKGLKMSREERQARRDEQKRQQEEVKKLKREQQASRGYSRSQQDRLKRLKPKEPKYQTKAIDYSQMRLVKADARTSIYVPISEDPQPYIDAYLSRKKAI